MRKTKKAKAAPRCKRYGKICFADEASAHKAVLRQTAINALFPDQVAGGKTGKIRYYKCDFCGSFHLTGDRLGTTTKERRKEMPNKQAQRERTPTARSLRQWLLTNPFSPENDKAQNAFDLLMEIAESMIEADDEGYFDAFDNKRVKTAVESARVFTNRPRRDPA